MYRALTQIEHVKQRSTMYIGSVLTKQNSSWLPNPDTTVMGLKECTTNDGLVKILNESIDNAVDNVFRDPPATVISVTLNATTFSVTNNGKHIPVMKGDDGSYVASVIFGKCLSGSNFNGDREGTTGVNGLGIKLANILSSEFTVETYDPTAKKLLIQKWTNGMVTTEGPKVKDRLKPKTASAITKVIFNPELKYFDGITSLEDVKAIIHSRLVQISSTIEKNVKVSFNGTVIPTKNFKSFVKLFGTSHMYAETSLGTQYAVAVSQDGFQHQSFVNNLCTTSDNSTHTRLVSNAVVKVLQVYFAKKYKDGKKLSRHLILSHVMLFVNTSISNADYKSQTKDELTTPIKDKIDEAKILRLLKKEGLIAKLEESMQSNSLNAMQKTLSSGKARAVHVEGATDAIDAGTSRSTGCTLYVCEGLSAATICAIGFSIVGRAKNGSYALRGKVINPRACSLKQLKENAEVIGLCKLLGLDFTKKYDTASDRKTLRYEHLCILADSDTDGNHICGLVINLIENFWPALVKSGFIHRFVTPLLYAKHKRNKRVHRFFNKSEFDKFAASNDVADYNVTYNKGLGSLLRADVVDCFTHMDRHLKTMPTDHETSTTLTNIFDKKTIEWRKEWLTRKNTEKDLDYSDPVMPITRFLKTELHGFSVYSLTRAIPSLMDGFKESQRKIFYATRKFGGNGPMKVAQLSGKVAEKTHYDHGEVSLQGAIIGMSQDFPGSNNINLLEPQGAFGSRLGNGKDAASARYIHTELMPVSRRLFLDSDDAVLTYKCEENIEVEPTFMLPTLPMVLINGSSGIATGFSTSIPSFNPRDIIRELKHRITTGEWSDRQLLPWSRGFKTNHLTADVNGKWNIYGIATVTGKGSIVTITEIPTNISVNDYEEKILRRLVDDGTVKSFIVDHVNENEPKFVVKMANPIGEKDDVLKMFKLKQSLSQANMNVLDKDNRVQHFSTPKELLKAWYDIRMEYITKRKAATLSSMDQELHEKKHKAVFIEAVVDGTIVVTRARDQVVHNMRHVLKTPSRLVESFLSMPLSSLTKEKVESLRASIEKISSDRDTYNAMSIAGIYSTDLNALDCDEEYNKRRK